uniref:Uncharacterized protein n=1 Tax=Rhizophora mucronata TaxID=61149 RepID=A0A2P2PHQ2_RHIMU
MIDCLRGFPSFFVEIMAGFVFLTDSLCSNCWECHVDL